jgi:hypothetical protein
MSCAWGLTAVAFAAAATALAREPRSDQRLTARSFLLCTVSAGTGRALDQYSEPLSRREPAGPFLNLEA